MGRVYWKKAVYLLVGQILSAIGVAALIQANIGLDPWNVLHLGISLTAHISLGAAIILASASAILLAALLGERFGVGTLVNVVLPGLFIDLIENRGWLPLMQTAWGGVAMMAAGQLFLALGTYYYLAAEMGAGPRDALMVACACLWGFATALCRGFASCSAGGWVAGSGWEPSFPPSPSARFCRRFSPCSITTPSRYTTNPSPTPGAFCAPPFGR